MVRGRVEVRVDMVKEVAQQVELLVETLVMKSEILIISPWPSCR